MEAFKELNERLKKSEDEKNQLMTKLKLNEEKFAKLKGEFEDVWKKLMEREKNFNDLKLNVLFLYFRDKLKNNRYKIKEILRAMINLKKNIRN